MHDYVWLFSIGLASIQADMLTQHLMQYWQRLETLHFMTIASLLAL